MKTAQEIFNSKAVRISTITVGVLLVALLSFAGGAAVGFHKARFSYAFGENYERNFIQGNRFDRDANAPRGNMMNNRIPDSRDLRNAHGVAGEILSISDTSIVIKDRDGKENTLSILPTTIIKNGRDTIALSDLKTGMEIVVIGKPSDTGTINAEFVRIFTGDFGANRGGNGMMNSGINQ